MDGILFAAKFKEKTDEDEGILPVVFSSEDGVNVGGTLLFFLTYTIGGSTF